MREEPLSLPIHVTAGNHAAPITQRGYDVYMTPPGICGMMLDAINLKPQKVWTPCGDEHSAIVADLEFRGFEVVVSDIHRGVDFLQADEAPQGCSLIVENMPFSLTARMVEHGLRLVRYTIVLQRVQFLESTKRASLFDRGVLKHIYLHRNRVPRMHREDWTGKKAAPAMFLAWFWFDAEHNGRAPTISWLTGGRHE